MLRLYDHPFSPYAQKVKIALREKGQAFEAPLPQGIGVGGALGEFVEANPRAEVPALIDGDVKLFDSTIILEYIEDKWPTPALLPASPAERARVRMLEEVMDTHYEAINWGLGELRAFKRATGELAEKIEARAAEQTQGYYTWLERQLGDRECFNGETFGWGDIAVVPYLNGSRGHGHIVPEDKAVGLAQPREQAAQRRRHHQGHHRHACRQRRGHGRRRQDGRGRPLQARIPRPPPGMDDQGRRHRRDHQGSGKGQYPLRSGFQLIPQG
jgi:glutathione S-transferase